MEYIVVTFDVPIVQGLINDSALLNIEPYYNFRDAQFIHLIKRCSALLNMEYIVVTFGVPFIQGLLKRVHTVKHGIHCS